MLMAKSKNPDDGAITYETKNGYFFPLLALGMGIEKNNKMNSDIRLE